MRLKVSTPYIFIFLLGTISSAVSDENVKVSELLPEPLTLESALKLVDLQHPDLRFVEADLLTSRSNLQQIKSENDLSIKLRASAAWIEPSESAINQENEDHKLGLTVNKVFYDFGRSSSSTSIATHLIKSQNYNYLNARQHQYLNVMKRYFDVVLADLQFYRYNEEMAVSYIQYDRTNIRQKLGQFTEIDVAEKNSEYQRIRRLRTYSQNQQRITRSLLAQALNKPNNLPSTVENPELNVLSRKLPDIEELQKRVLDKNPLLTALREKLAAAKNNIQYSKSNYNPNLSGSFQTYSYERETGSSDKWRANITLDVPLWSGDRVDANVAKAKSSVYKVEAEISQQKLLLQQQVLELVLGIATLKIKYDEVSAVMDFTELSLDKSRALYELEVTSDLGYSMVKFSEAERNVVKTNFEIALAWAQLDALSGILLNQKIKR